MKLSGREWICLKCGTIHSRGISTVMNIIDFVLHRQNAIGCKKSINNIVHREAGLTAAERSRELSKVVTQ